MGGDPPDGSCRKSESPSPKPRAHTRYTAAGGRVWCATVSFVQRKVIMRHLVRALCLIRSGHGHYILDVVHRAITAGRFRSALPLQRVHDVLQPVVARDHPSNTPAMPSPSRVRSYHALP